MKNEKVILVDENDTIVGHENKLDAHINGLLHRAFSIFVFNSSRQLMIHKRAYGKYHSGGLWTNTCCSHPRPGELAIHAAHRRLIEEMGFDCYLEKAFSFIYRKELDNNLIEHELDHVFIGLYNNPPNPDTNEVADWKWVNIDILLDDIINNPKNYTEWFKLSIHNAIEYLDTKMKHKKAS